ncbi:MAG: bifunctional phosphoglucose/phosphomannose isomerase [Thermoplasmatota archaeon]
MGGLSSLEDIRAVDRSDMVRVLRSIPEMVRMAYALPRPSLAISRPAGVVVAGMGGSAIGGDLLQSWMVEKGGPPVIVNRDYDLPAFVGPRHIVFAVSYSGNTEETISAYEQAVKRGCRPVTISSGGALEKMSGAGLHIKLPPGLQPRAAVSLMLLPMLGVVEDLGLARCGGEVDEAVELLRALTTELAPERPEGENQAKRIALGLHGCFPMVFSGPFLAPVAKRWRTQLNENSKVLAREDVLPEMDHNDLVAWSEDPMAERCGVVLLRDSREHPRVVKRMELTRRLGLDRARFTSEVRSRGEGALARLLSALVVGDFASFYLAVLRGVDPTPVHVIEKLKRELAG